jgi:hypothetical protein
MSVCGHDLDDVFAYQTPKIVVVRDRWLGLLKLFFMLGIFIFVVVSVCYADPPRYVKLAEPIGSIGYISLKRVQFTTEIYRDFCALCALRMTCALPLIHPRVFSAYPIHTLAWQPSNKPFITRNMTYCSDYDPNTSQGPSKYIDQHQCIVWDESDAVFPPDQYNGMFITTRATISQQHRLVCCSLFFMLPPLLHDLNVTRVSSILAVPAARKIRY